LDQGLGIHGRAGVELAGVDRALNAAEIDFVELLGEWRVFEAALRQPAMERHLAALEPFDAHARAGGLALAAATGRLAGAGADAAAEAVTFLAGAWTVGEFVKFHCRLLVLLSSGPAINRASLRDCPQDENSRDVPGHDDLFAPAVVYAHQMPHFRDHTAGRRR